VTRTTTIARPGRGCLGSTFPRLARPATPPPEDRWLADPARDARPAGPSPTPVDGATWQPRVIPGSERFRVFLDGEPVAGAVAASVDGGWVDVARGSDHGDLRYEPDLLGELMGDYVKRVRGVVTLVACRAGE
jgi:hypothetical protein